MRDWLSKTRIFQMVDALLLVSVAFTEAVK